ncbi:hypothetical protein H0A66_13385 [Alcaligenaceae bacterium]|nr:hypothetical protein [Alcaligenaceae bacterium]
MIRIGLIILLSSLMLACTPSYNWREVTVADGAAKAFFPDKPVTQTRPLNYSGHQLSFSMTTASVDDTLFAVGYAPLPEALRQTPEMAREFALSVMAELYQNLGLPPPAQLPELGTPVVIEGRSPQGPIRMRVAVWLTSYALIEGIVMADQASFPEPQADEFLRGLQVVQ